ncbi:MAG: hypothetical protein RL138_139 [Bacteroidota bacterium]|nr:Rne/Rng family ribonuclease [Chitinophagales bacterium]
MNKELIINWNAEGVDIALLEEKRLVELHKERTGNQFNVGDIYLGRVARLMTGLNAAFVNVGYEKEAFLHYTDLGPNLRSLLKFTDNSLKGQQGKLLQGFEIEPEIIKTGKINQVLKSRMPILVQILKEPIGTKGPRLNAEISLPGRYLILNPFTNFITISKKIVDKEERMRLTKIMESIRPDNFGVILRTAAAGKQTGELHQDLLQLSQKWEDMKAALNNATPPLKVMSELDKTSSILRDLLNDNFSKIIVNDKNMSADLKAYIGKIAPGKESIVHFYSGQTNIFDAYGVTMQIKASFGKQVPMGSGGSLIIEKTEALHVIDVNSGNNVGSANKEHEENVLKVNLEAAKEVARQLRLRDMGGIIIIDFIDLKDPKNRLLLFNTMRDEMKSDRAKHTILPVSKFGVMQITRQRVRPEVQITTTEACPTCNGSGKIGASVLLVDEIEKAMHHLFVNNNQSSLKLVVHPFVEKYLKAGLWSTRMKWMLKYKRSIQVMADANYPLTQYKFFDKVGDEIDLK